MIPDPEPVTSAPTVKAWLDVRRIVTAVAAAALVAVVLLLALEDFAGHLWYSTRQATYSTAVGSTKVPPVGAKAGVLQIPTLNLSVQVVQGDGPSQLRGGPGHDPSSPLLSQRGNTVIFGHRHDWGAPFSSLGRLTVGSKIYAQGRSSTSPPLVYTVTDSRTTSSNDTKPFAPSGDYRLTLVTAAGGHFGSERLVVTAVSGGNAGPGRPTSSTSASVGSGTGTLVADLIITLLAIGVGAALVVSLGRRYGSRLAAVVVAPVGAAAVLGLFLVVDQVLYTPLA